jgi:hypothetical protein
VVTTHADMKSMVIADRLALDGPARVAVTLAARDRGRCDPGPDRHAAALIPG